MISFRTTFVLAALIFTTHTRAESAGADPEAWYRDDYAPVFAVGVTDRLEPVLAHYAETVLLHEANSGYRLVRARDWIQPALNEWDASGWLGSELADLSVEQINPTSTLFQARWQDIYANGSEEPTCGLYIAGLKDGRWRFTGFFDTGCEDVDGE